MKDNQEPGKNVSFDIDDIYEEDAPLFEVQASLNLSKHFGGTQATDELLQACTITEDYSVLDVGCGVGQTAVYIAKKYGCHVTGIDISERMVIRAKERKKDQVVAEAEFRVADAQDLPFEDNQFDIVMTESVLSFIKNKQKALAEFKRVTKPGGYIGLNETLLINKAEKPPEDVIQALMDSDYFTAEVMTEEKWRSLLKEANLPIIYDNIQSTKSISELKSHINRFGWLHTIKSTLKSLFWVITKPKHRKMLKSAPKDLGKYLNYGILVAKKPKE